MKNLYLPLLLLAILMVSCQKDLEDNQTIYQGKWESPDHTIIIYNNGKGSCIQKKLILRCNGYVNITDKKMVFTSNSLDAHVFRVKFDIHQKPEIDEKGITYMILDGERFEQ